MPVSYLRKGVTGSLIVRVMVALTQIRGAMQGFFEENALVAVQTTQPLDRLLDYRAPEGGCHLGAFVEVPLGPRKVIGVVWGPGRGDYDYAKIRQVIRVLDCAPMRDEMREFLERCGAYTLTPMNAMLRLATRAPGLGDPPSMQKIYRLGEGEPPRMTDPRRRVLDACRDMGGLSLTLKELAETAGVTTSVVKGLVKSGAVREEQSPRDTAFALLDPDHGGKELTGDQEAGAQVLRRGQASLAYNTVLLKGVTGSGKTEVYLEAVAECLRQGRQALVLLPEIALTGEFLTRVEARFGAKPAEWHSGVTMTERRRVWKMVAQGQAQMVVGARSALFLPFQRLGLVVVDEAYAQFADSNAFGLLASCPNLVILRTFSKAFGLAGLRFGYLFARPELAREIGKVQLPHHVGFFTQLAATALLKNASVMEQRVASLVAEREKLIDRLEEIGKISPLPSQSNYILIESTAMEAPELFERLLEHGVLIRNVSNYPGLARYLRITVGDSGENDALIEALAEVLG